MNIFLIFVGFFSLLYAITLEIHCFPFLFFLFLITFGIIRAFSLFKDLCSRSSQKNKTWVTLIFQFLFILFIYFLSFYLLICHNILPYELKKMSYFLFFSGNLFFKAALLFCLFILLWAESLHWEGNRYQIRMLTYGTVFIIGWRIYGITNQKSAITHMPVTSFSSKSNSSSKLYSGLLAGAGTGAAFVSRRRKKTK